jgi:superfamily II DNA or RNA helicase
MVTLEESNVRVWLKGERGELDALVERLRFHPPEYWRSPKYQLWKRTDGKSGWDGTLTLVHRVARDQAWVQRGHQERLLAAAAQEDIEVEWKERRKPLAGITVDDVPPDLLKGLTLDLDQRTCVAELCRNAFGTVEITTSGGKTAVLFSVALLIRRRFPDARFLYVTPSERLVRQVVKEARKLAPSLRVSQFGGGVKSETGRDMVVATMASLNRNHDRFLVSGWYKTFSGLLFDEVHHVGAPATRKVVGDIPTFFRFGASASVKDSSRPQDKMRGLAVEGAFGPARHRTTLAPLIEVGRVAKPILYLVDCPEWNNRFQDLPNRAKKGTKAWCLMGEGWKRGTYVGPVYERDERGVIVRNARKEPTVVINKHLIELDEGGEFEVESRWCLLHRQHDEGVVRFRDRNRLVVEWVRHYVSKGWPTLVIATRTLHVLIIETLLAEAGLAEVRTLTGEDTSKTRDEAFAWLVGTPGAVLVSPLVKEGVSLPDLKAGVIADYVAGPDVARQMIGRFIRRKPAGENEAHVTLFIDRQTSAMRRGSLALVAELEKTRGFSFFWPCLGPDYIGAGYEAADLDK